MQVYTAVRSRNTLGLTLARHGPTQVRQPRHVVREHVEDAVLALVPMHGQSGDTGDAAELIARWGPRGRFDGGYNNLSTLAGDLAAIKETHHFYPVLFYFRFEDVFYAPPRMLLLALDAAALVRTALDPRELGWLQESAALT